MSFEFDAAGIGWGFIVDARKNECQLESREAPISGARIAHLRETVIIPTRESLCERSGESRNFENRALIWTAPPRIRQTKNHAGRRSPKRAPADLELRSFLRLFAQSRDEVRMREALDKATSSDLYFEIPPAISVR